MGLQGLRRAHSGQTAARDAAVRVGSSGVRCRRSRRPSGPERHRLRRGFRPRRPVDGDQDEVESPRLARSLRACATPCTMGRASSSRKRCSTRSMAHGSSSRSSVTSVGPPGRSMSSPATPTISNIARARVDRAATSTPVRRSRPGALDRDQVPEFDLSVRNRARSSARSRTTDPSAAATSLTASISRSSWVKGSRSPANAVAFRSIRPVTESSALHGAPHSSCAAVPSDEAS